MTHTMTTPLTIGSLNLPSNLMLAPMAGITNLPMRIIAREQGAGLCFTEMVSANGLVRDGRKTLELLRSTPADRPLGIQLFGDNPELLAAAAQQVSEHGDVIDINMGCPVKKVVNSGAGSALLREPAKVATIIRAVRKATNLPLTIKIRTGWESGSISYLEIGRIAEAEGCNAVTLHPRSRVQMFEGKSDWSKIGELKKALRIPVIGSGDLFSGSDVTNMLKQTGCDGAMIARGALGNPWIFREAGDTGQAPTPNERSAAAARHMELFAGTYGERVALLEMRKHLCWYSRGLSGGAEFRAQVNTLQNLEQLRLALQAFFSIRDNDA